ncbi:MAG: YceI family protein, partial [Planctomycetales bacterium]|nr:YceI family protein [Planctomycetales bacterium]
QTGIGTTTQTRPQPGQVNLEYSRVYIHVGKVGLGHEHAVVGKLRSGTLRLGAAAQAGQLVFEMQSFDADGAAARKYLGLEGDTSDSTRRQVNENMRGPLVLDVERYPTAVFQIDSSLPEPPADSASQSAPGSARYRLKGKFQLHGASQPLEFVATAAPQKGWQHVNGGFRMLQSHYGIKPFTKAFGAIGVADELRIWGDLWVVPSPAETSSAATRPLNR